MITPLAERNTDVGKEGAGLGREDKFSIEHNELEIPLNIQIVFSRQLETWS